MRFHSSLVAVAAAVAPLALPAPAQAQSEADAILLHGAIREGDIAAVRRFLDRGVPVDILSSGGYSPLMTAANEGKLEIAQLLLARGADASIKTPQGWDAAYLARLNGHAAVAAVLQAPVAAGPAAPPAAPRPAPPVQAAPAVAPPRPAPAPAPPAARTANTPWPTAGAFKAGDQVLYSGTAGKTWQRGGVRSVDPRYGYNIEGVTGSVDPFHVTSTARQPYWTGYFIGDWRISVPMAVNVRTDGRDLYRVFSGGLRLPPLRINGDGSYAWRVTDAAGAERLIQGRWRPNPAGPGVILEKGDKGADWLAYNNSVTGSALGQTLILSADGHTHHDGSRIGP